MNYFLYVTGQTSDGQPNETIETFFCSLVFIMEFQAKLCPTYMHDVPASAMDFALNFVLLIVKRGLVLVASPFP